MRRSKSMDAHRRPGRSTDGPKAKDGAWLIEMRPADSTPRTEERSASENSSSRDLFETTFRHLRDFLDRKFR